VSKPQLPSFFLNGWRLKTVEYTNLEKAEYNIGQYFHFLTRFGGLNENSMQLAIVWNFVFKSEDRSVVNFNKLPFQIVYYYNYI
jgi:hypothetical protein